MNKCIVIEKDYIELKTDSIFVFNNFQPTSILETSYRLHIPNEIYFSLMKFCFDKATQKVI